MSDRARIAEMFRVLREPATSDELAKWRSTRLVAEVWCCNDDLDGLCYQPHIDRVGPNLTAGYPWVRREEVWRGTFVNEPTPDEYANLTTELREGAALHDIILVEKDGYWPYGEREE